MEKFDSPGVNLALYPLRVGRSVMTHIARNIKEGFEIAVFGSPTVDVDTLVQQQDSEE